MVLGFELRTLDLFQLFFQARAHEVFDRRLCAERGLRGADGVVRVNLFEAERHQRQHGIVGFLVIGRERPLRAGGLPRAGGADFVAQLHNDALGGLFADAGDLGKRLSHRRRPPRRERRSR